MPDHDTSPASGERSAGDVYGEAWRREVHGLIRPLWSDMPDDDVKAMWRHVGEIGALRQPTRTRAILDRLGLPVPAELGQGRDEHGG